MINLNEGFSGIFSSPDNSSLIITDRFYNFLVPTPFYHLSVAEEILQSQELAEGNRSFLLEHREAFLFGNTAPDVQVLSGQSRPATHFFDLPIKPSDPLPWNGLLSAYPGLLQTNELPVSQVAFLAGYLCHLQADWNWVLNIFLPVFGPGTGWSTFSERLYLHNVLRSYIDLQILPDLLTKLDDELNQVAPHGWLPFVEDIYLFRWRDLLAGQLCEGCETQTVEVFAARQGLSPEDYYQMLASEETMDEVIFAHLPRRSLQRYRQELVQENITLLSDYLRDI
jgi:hypothetical protein